MYQGKYSSKLAKEAKKPIRLSPLVSMLFFPLAVLYSELLLHIFIREVPFFGAALFRIVLFSLAGGFLLFLILDLLPWKRFARITGGVILFVGMVVLCVEYCCKDYFKTYFGLGYSLNMAGQVVGDFAGNIVQIFFTHLPFILLSTLPFVVYCFLNRQLVPQEGHGGRLRKISATAMICLQLVAFMSSCMSSVGSFYTYDFATNASTPQFGLLTAVRLELTYNTFGAPVAPLEQFDSIPEADPPEEDTQPSEPSDPGVTMPTVYGYNKLDIDFTELENQTSDSTLRSMHSYFGSKIPSQQNEYTGFFKDKNLILITAEAFSPYVVSKELTPTLYRLSHEEGFVFTNYYQPNWTQSTTGGEFAVMTGVIPTWIGSELSFGVSAKNNMHTCLGWQFSNIGYRSLAYHNNTYTYYGRDKTHPNLGYDYHGIGNGLQLQGNDWPRSDLEMMEATVDGYIQDYVTNGTKFHTYYITVSGHCNYNWGGNDMSKRNKDAAMAAFPNASETVQAYIACNLELEKAMTYLVQKLEAAGIADDTVIALSADHYPYAMAEGNVDYYNELTGLNDSERDTSRYRNTLILWCGSMKEPVVVDTPCSSIDIIPTLSNLFGLKYDSRLYSGRDIFATNYSPSRATTCMPLVVFANTGYGNSWITAAGTYEASSDTFIPNEGITVDDSYISAVKKIVNNKYNYAKLVVTQDYYSKVLN